MHFLRGNVPLDASHYPIFQNIPGACGVAEGAKQSVLSVMVFLYFCSETEHISSWHACRSHGGSSLDPSVTVLRDDLVTLLAPLIFIALWAFDWEVCPCWFLAVTVSWDGDQGACTCLDELCERCFPTAEDKDYVLGEEAHWVLISIKVCRNGSRLCRARESD